MKKNRLLGAPNVLAWTLTGLAVLAAIAPRWLSSAVPYDGTLAVLTLTLIAVIWYTYFTHRLTEHAEESLRFSRGVVMQQQQRDRDKLRILVKRFAEYLSSLPTGDDQKVVKRLRECGPPPSASDIEHLEELASRIHSGIHHVAATAASSVKDIVPYIRGAQNGNYSTAQRDRYTIGLPAAIDSLETLSKLLKD